MAWKEAGEKEGMVHEAYRGLDGLTAIVFLLTRADSALAVQLQCMWDERCMRRAWKQSTSVGPAGYSWGRFTAARKAWPSAASAPEKADRHRPTD